MEATKTKALIELVTILEDTCKVNNVLLKRYKEKIEELTIRVKELEIQLAEVYK